MTITQRKIRAWIMLIKGEDILKITYPDYSSIRAYYRDGSTQHLAMINGTLMFDCDTYEAVATSEQIRYIKKVRRIQNETERQNKGVGEAQGGRDYR